jgi:hypothetical protein
MITLLAGLAMAAPCLDSFTVDAGICEHWGQK